MKKTLIAVVGPTAIGKTSWAIKLAKYYNTEVVSADSRQFYREMSIGTAVPDSEELKEVVHHFIQHISIHEPWSVGHFEREGIALLHNLFKNRDIVIAVGGSGLYLKALIEGLDHFPETEPTVRERLNEQLRQEGLTSVQERLKSVDPEYYEVVDLQNPHRIIRALEVYESSGKAYSAYLGQPREERHFSTIWLGLTAARSEVYQRIEDRVDKMMDNGLLEEAEKLVAYKELSALQTVGYQELFNYLEGNWSLEFAVSEIKKNSRRFAKRQMTWFRKNEDIIWVDYNQEFTDVVETLDKAMHDG